MVASTRRGAIMADAVDGRRIPEYVRRELSEVYLLMDHLAGQRDKSLEAALAPPGPLTCIKDRDITLRELCAIHWPPGGDERPADTLSLVLTAKDRLSHAAYPATGLSIAFSYLSTYQETDGGGDKHGLPSSIFQFAKDAFPGLERKRNELAKTVRRLKWALLVALLATCSVTVDLAVGQRVLADFKWLAHNPQVFPRHADLPPPCNDLFVSAQTANAKSAKDAMPASDDPVARCMALLRVLPVLESWNDWHVWPVRIFAGPPEISDELVRNGYTTELTRLLVTTLNYNVLPPLLGALAAIAGEVRMIGRRIHCNQLTPRDLELAWPRIYLGVMMAAVIGLLTSPGASNGLFGALGGGAAASLAGADTSDTVALSPPAYAFLAGFATDRIFRWLDDLINRIFSVKSRSQN
jgi:hypothetical protein